MGEMRERTEAEGGEGREGEVEVRWKMAHLVGLHSLLPSSLLSTLYLLLI